jgi:hypothetical protein
MVTGIFIYIGMTFFFNILADNLSNETYDNYWYLTYFGDIAKNIFATIGISIYVSKTRVVKKSETIPNLDMI